VKAPARFIVHPEIIAVIVVLFVVGFIAAQCGGPPG
jgi:hypothetical protein